MEKHTFSKTTIRLMISIYPLIAIGGYSYLLEIKTFFMGAVIIICFWGYLMSLLTSDVDKYYKLIVRCVEKKNWNSKLIINKIQNFMKKLNKLDICVMIFIIMQMISFIGAEDKKNAWFGINADGMGVFFYIIAIMLYILIRTGYVYDKKDLYIGLVSADIVIVFAIIQFMGCDILRLFPAELKTGQMDFLSTIGNTGLFSCYVSLVVPFALYELCCGRKKILCIISLILCFIGIFCSNCDAGYLGLIAGVGGTFFVIKKTKENIGRYLVGIACFALAVILFNIVYNAFGDYARNTSAITSRITNVNLSVDKQGNKRDIDKFLDSVSEEKKIIDKYLTFNDDWGTDRGYIWSRLMRVYLYKADLWQKCFGQGSVYDVVMDEFGEEMYNEKGYYVSDAHNEILNMLITNGMIVVIVYSIIIILAIVRPFTVKYGSSDIKKACSISVITYITMGMFGISQPITGIFIWLLIGILAGAEH